MLIFIAFSIIISHQFCPSFENDLKKSPFNWVNLETKSVVIAERIAEEVSIKNCTDYYEDIYNRTENYIQKASDHFNCSLRLEEWQAKCLNQSCACFGLLRKHINDVFGDFEA